MKLKDIDGLGDLNHHIARFQGGFTGKVLKRIYGDCDKEIISLNKKIQKRQRSLGGLSGREERIVLNEIKKVEERRDALSNAKQVILDALRGVGA